jgi:glutathione reductase (NADPH)
MVETFDLIVIGTGTAGATAAHRCRAAGWRVAVVDARPFGGTCALRGCDPKKVLVGAAELVDWHRRMQGHGVAAENVHIHWPDLMRFKRSFTEPIPQASIHEYQQAGIVPLQGQARFLDRTTLQIGKAVHSARHVLIASGAKPRPLPMPGADLVISSDQFLELTALPKRIVFIGGGYISFEFAHLAVRAGAEVSICHQRPQPLKGFDPDLVAHLVTASQALGIQVQANTQVRAIAQRAGDLQVQLATEEGQRTLVADLVVHGAGRVPDVADLDLEAAGVASNERGVLVNAYLQSVSNPAVYAAGDAAASGGLPLTPVASAEGRVASHNLLHGNQQQVDYRGVPSVVFTIPPLAAVGLSEREAKAQGLPYVVCTAETSDWYSSRRTNEQHTAHKVLVEAETDRILGAHLLGSGTEEMINLFGLAIRHGLRRADLKAMIYAYPTKAADIGDML